jgi:hypothetical protein
MLNADEEDAMRISRMRNTHVLLIALSFACAIWLSVAAEGESARGGKVTIPATTSLTVKLDEAVSAKTAENGGSFTVTFSAPVEVGGATIIPAGATGAGLVSNDGRQSSRMELNSVFVHGRSYRVSTSPIVFNQKASYRPGTKLTFDLMLSLSVQ